MTSQDRRTHLDLVRQAKQERQSQERQRVQASEGNPFSVDAS